MADEPIIATACVVAADLIGAAMMVPKTYRDPDSETLATFTLASLSGALAAGAVGDPKFSLLLFPIYFSLVNGAIAILIHHRRAVIHSSTGRRWAEIWTPPSLEIQARHRESRAWTEEEQLAPEAHVNGIWPATGTRQGGADRMFMGAEAPR